MITGSALRRFSAALTGWGPRRFGERYLRCRNWTDPEGVDLLNLDKAAYDWVVQAKPKAKPDADARQCLTDLGLNEARLRYD